MISVLRKYQKMRKPHLAFLKKHHKNLKKDTCSLDSHYFCENEKDFPRDISAAIAAVFNAGGPCLLKRLAGQRTKSFHAPALYRVARLLHTSHECRLAGAGFAHLLSGYRQHRVGIQQFRRLSSGHVLLCCFPNNWIIFIVC